MRLCRAGTAIAVILLTLSCGGAWAGQLHPDFARQLMLTLPGEVAHGIVVMSDRADVDEMRATMEAAPTLAEGHAEIITALQERARSTQGDLLAYLEQEQRQGRVESYQSFWIFNAVAVSADADLLHEIARRPDVELVFEDFEIIQLEPVKIAPAPEHTRTVEPGLLGINADLLWDKGITGNGTIVSNIDTGVDGDHEAFGPRWRGNVPGVPWEECWFDPVTFTNYPWDDGSHGTHTMGTITGKHDDDIIGVAYDALWIAASCIDRVFGPGRFAVYISAIEWTADPDGNPETFDEVPDVVSNSWGINTDLPACDPTFWEAIDMAEAAGAVVVFAAGNEGYTGPASLRNPADRNTTPVNCYSVGALQVDQQTIASFSSRGPSTCDFVTIKPEVCAQGDDVRSSVPGNGYAYYSGTSMATPHVAGAVALMRQAHPNATSDEVKYAILNTAFDLGVPGDDNDYGMGRVDCLAAAQYLLANIGVTLDLVPEAASVPPGGDLNVTVYLTNGSAKEVTYDGWADVTLPNSQPYAGNPIIGPKSITLNPGQTKEFHLTHHVPANAPLGVYTYEGMYGWDHDLLAASDSFTFTVQ